MKRAVILTLATLAFVTALGGMSPLALLCGVFIALTGIWAAVRMPPFWRYSRRKPTGEELAGRYELRDKSGKYHDFCFELTAEGGFHCRRFPFFLKWPPPETDTALAGSGHWELERSPRQSWMLTLILDEVDASSAGKATANVSHAKASFWLGKKKTSYSLLTWVGGFVRGRSIEFARQDAPHPAQSPAGN